MMEDKEVVKEEAVKEEKEEEVRGKNGKWRVEVELKKRKKAEEEDLLKMEEVEEKR